MQYSDLICIGSVYSGKDIKTERDVALKFEVIQDLSSKLAHEYSIYWHIVGGKTLISSGFSIGSVLEKSCR